MMTSDSLDDEIEALKQRLYPTATPDQGEAKDKFSAVMGCIRSLSTDLELCSDELRNRCLASKTKAVEAEKSLQVAIAHQDIGRIFQCFIDKTVHTRLVKAMETQSSRIGIELVKLKDGLALIEKQ